MTASEAMACTTIEFGLFLLLFAWEGLILIAIGAVAYLVARATYNKGTAPGEPYFVPDDLPWFADRKDIRPPSFQPDDHDQTQS